MSVCRCSRVPPYISALRCRYALLPWFTFCTMPVVVWQQHVNHAGWAATKPALLGWERLRKCRSTVQMNATSKFTQSHPLISMRDLSHSSCCFDLLWARSTCKFVSMQLEPEAGCTRLQVFCAGFWKSLCNIIPVTCLHVRPSVCQSIFWCVDSLPHTQPTTSCQT